MEMLFVQPQKKKQDIKLHELETKKNNKTTIYEQAKDRITACLCVGLANSYFRKQH
jgi:hypothetical protein